MKPSVHPIPMPSQISEVQVLSTYKCHIQVVDNLLDIWKACGIFEL
jgi:hypothetical protein